MTFDSPWLLLLALVPLAWAAWEWRGRRHRAGLVLKTLATIAVLVALSEPVLQFQQSRVALAVAVDCSG